MEFVFARGGIPDVIEITHDRLGDSRGFLAEVFREAEFLKAGVPKSSRFVQENHVGSPGGVLRGLHYQLPPRAQGKLVRCVRGAVFDVAVDLRRGSPHVGRYVACELSAENRKMLYVPPGFAHGYLASAEWNEVIYKVTDYYSPEHERGLRWDDPGLAVPWPLRNPVVNSRDAAFPAFAESVGPGLVF